MVWERQTKVVIAIAIIVSLGYAIISVYSYGMALRIAGLTSFRHPSPRVYVLVNGEDYRLVISRD